MPTTEREALVAEAVSDLAARADGFDPLELLYDLTAYVVALLPVRSAGVTVVDDFGQVDYLTASDDVCRHLEEDQIDLDEGPCMDSTRSRSALVPIMLAGAGPSALRWPRFTPRALRAGITGVAAVPLHSTEHTIGAVTLMTAAPPLPTPQDLRLAQALASTAADCLQRQRALHSKDKIISQLQTALDSRIVIEQAKGVLSSRLQVGMDEAFARLRGHARARRQKLTDLAAQVAQGAIPTGLDAAS